MTAKRFTHKINQLGMQFICYDDKSELLGTFADADGVTHIVKLLNELHEEKEDMQEEIEHCHRIIETLVAQKGVNDYMDLLNLCDKDILIENGWEILEEEE